MQVINDNDESEIEELTSNEENDKATEADDNEEANNLEADESSEAELGIILRLSNEHLPINS